MSPPSEPIREQIRQILLKEWDPTNASRSEYARSEYDTYIGPLLDLIRGGAGEEQIIDFLAEREREIMCFPSLGRERLKRPAKQLLALKSEA